MRRDLQAAFIAYREANANLSTGILDANVPAKGSARWLELFEETEFTRPVDFHAWRVSVQPRMPIRRWREVRWMPISSRERTA